MDKRFNHNYRGWIRNGILLIYALLFVGDGIGASSDAAQESFTDVEVTFTIGSDTLFGLLTKPPTEGPHPVIILLHGSDRGSGDNPYQKAHSDQFVQSGFAVLRYDSPGSGKSTGSSDFETFEYRTQEAIAAVKYLQSRVDINADGVGLWGISQGGWICQMAAAEYDSVAFIIPVSGPGVTVPEQEVYRVEMSSRAAGFTEDDISKAVLMKRLIVDVAMLEPAFKEINRNEGARLGSGPWTEMINLVYPPDPLDPATELEGAIRVFNASKEESWSEFLYVDKILSALEGLPPEQWAASRSQIRAIMTVDPADYLSRVHCPVLAIFGSADTVIPVGRSVTLYEKYLREADNKHFVIKVIPNGDHNIKIEGEFAPSYFKTIAGWLRHLSLD
ncbi:MAG: alpha/beta fold hydrolase [Candidatus Neomarinimicrobiota bacterium]